ncbi:MAG: hypothetical protein ABIF10_04745 [Candidatus Woesearchaeota archaeon]
MLCKKTPLCANCHDHYSSLRPLVKEIIVSKHFEKDLPGFDVSLIVDCDHAGFTRLHKFEETIDGNHIFRAIKDHTHIVYCIDKSHNLIFLRAFSNFKAYAKFLDDKKAILAMISDSSHVKYTIHAAG